MGMPLLTLGLILFLGAHSLRIVAEGWRSRQVERLGALRWKALVAVVSVVGFGLIVWGYGLARQQPVVLWSPPRGMNHLAALLMVVAFILLAAAYVPRNGLRARLRHPMVLSVKVWALAHLASNGNLADVVLFGAFLVWAVLDFRAARGRDRLAGVVPAPGTTAGTLATVAVGLAAWAGFAFKAHVWLIGVRPLGM